MPLFLGVVSECLALDICFTCPSSSLCSSESVEGTLSRVGVVWPCSVLAWSCVTSRSALSQSIIPAQNCGVRLRLGDGQAALQSFRSDLITKIAFHLQNNLVCIKSLDGATKGWKCSCIGAEVSLNSVVMIWSYCLWHFPFLYPSAFTCRAALRMVSSFITLLCINYVRICSEWSWS